ncbi:cis-prenyltransferase-like protein [Leishmania tarentolae]|uniref:Cis-prenyltransferase-like protein n=1 Tax=Leishmania tarentolae TaxID=5689 RepID=A0A640KGJ2_LEITA|nr:cis-prenyltransferase-like protein [Leishmania tarentolae]
MKLNPSPSFFFTFSSLSLGGALPVCTHLIFHEQVLLSTFLIPRPTDSHALTPAIDHTRTHALLMGTLPHLRYGATLVQHGALSAFNDSHEIAALRMACDTFGVVCLSVLVFAVLGNIALALLQLYSRGGVPPAAKTFTVSKPHNIAHTVRHLGIIMDGNRRYGSRHSTATVKPDPLALEELRNQLCSATELTATYSVTEQSSWLGERYKRFAALIQNSSLDGHRVGGEKLLEVIEYCMEAHIRMMTVYAFSTDNWGRPAAEVDALVSLFFFFFDRIRKEALDRHIFVRFIATEPFRLPLRMVEFMRSIECETRALQPRRLVLNICVSYSGQSEVVAACNRILTRRLRDGTNPTSVSAVATEVTKNELDREMLRSITQGEHEVEDVHIFNIDVSVEPELILRTSGEQRISNFLLYECAYSEFVFLAKAWPEVTQEDIQQALRDFARRDKRKGR